MGNNWHKLNRERSRLIKKKWNAENKDRCIAYNKRSRAKDLRRRIFRDSKNSAKQKGIEHTIEIDDIIVPEVCPVFNEPWDKPGFTASIDRIDNTKGYIKGNVQVISLFANKLKRDASQQQLEQFANWILNGKEVHSNS